MLCVLLFVFLISGALTQDSELDEEDLVAERYNHSCIIPPSDIISNGRFTVEGYGDDEQPPAGKKTYSYVLKVTCDPGFSLQGWYLVQCVTDKGTDELPECLPTCKRSSPDVFSCGTGFGTKEARCLAPRNDIDISSRSRLGLQCGVTPHVFRTAVVNGREANREDVPWHAGVYTKTTRPYMQICGGTIVSNNVVISAAHCFWSDTKKQLPAENYAVAVGKLYRPWNDTNDPDAQKFDVQEIRIPPRYQGSATNYQDDIALLILGAPFVIQLTKFITPACLDFNFEFDERQLSQGKLGRVAGWGLDSADGPSSQVLNVVELPVVSIEQCIAGAEPGFLSSITSDKICAGYNNGTAVCKGDSGGGLVVPEVVDGTSKYFLRGIVSTAPRSEHLCNVYAVATFTHVVKHEHFIMAAINQTPLVNEAPTIAPIPPPPTTIEDTTNPADIVVTEEYRNVEVIAKNATDTLPIGDNTNVEGTTKNILPSTIPTEDFTLFVDTTKTAPKIIVEDTKKVANLIVEDNENNVETTTEYDDRNELLKPDIVNELSPLPLTNLNSTHSKQKRNNSATIINADVHFPKTDADLAKIPHINDKVTEKMDLEPITNPPFNNNDNFDENIKDMDLDTNGKENIEEEDNKKENIDVNEEQSSETVISNQNPVTGTMDESENIKSDSSANKNDNIAKTPAVGVPIGISIPFEIINSNENSDILPIDNESSIDIDASNANTNDQVANIPSSAETIEVNEEEILETANPKVPSSNMPIKINVGTINSNENPGTVKESSINDDSITIWPTLTPSVVPIGADITGSNKNPGSVDDGVEFTQTTAILEDYWVTASPDCHHDIPGHPHHHWPHHHNWQEQPTGPNSHPNWHKPPNGPSHHNWHKHPNWQNSQQNPHDWQKPPSWQGWNPTNWQQKRFHPFLEYHQGFSQQPPRPNYGPWFGRFRK